MKDEGIYPQPTPQELAIRKRVRLVADQCLRPYVISDDENAFFRREAFNTLASQGLSSISLAKEYGGQGLSYRCYFASIEEMARVSLSMAVTVGVTNLVQGALVAFGNEKQKQTFLFPLAKGEYLGAFSLSEPHSGSDAAALKCQATCVEGGYLLNGIKQWCTSAGVADLYLVMARTGAHPIKGVSSFLVPKQSKGFRVGKQEDKMGLRASPLAELIFENCFVPGQNLLGEQGKGLTVAFAQLETGRLGVAAASIGIALSALERVWKLYKAGKIESDLLEGIRLGVASHYASLQAVRALLGSAAELKDAKKPTVMLASSAKLLASELAMQITSDVVSWMGCYGLLKEFEVERLMRDAKCLQIVEGTSQIQQLVLAREMEGLLL
ncbi:MAG: acyl-CoA dehydrogenase family protein [Deltaproteobacteria bacterium]|nr:acyl-CoA dehydrogenase family protein [Deltaproteobacteria bacterium]